MFRRIEKFADLYPVSASGRASAELPAAGTYHSITLRGLDGGAIVTAANMAASISDVTLRLNGVNVYETNAAALADLYESRYNHDGLPAGLLHIPLTPHWWSNRNESEAMGYGMAAGTPFQLEVNFTALAGTAGYADQIEVYAERISEPRPLGTHMRVNRYARSFASAGEQEINDIPIAPGAVTTGIGLQYNGAAATITKVEVIANSQVVMSLPTQMLEFLTEREEFEYMVTGAANDFLLIPFNTLQNGNGFLAHAGLEDLRLRVTWSAAPSGFTLFHETIHGLGKANR